jgi:hypothetical protein
MTELAGPPACLCLGYVGVVQDLGERAPEDFQGSTNRRRRVSGTSYASQPKHEQLANLFCVLIAKVDASF